MIAGVLAGLLTCALWGLTFVAPRTIAPFTTWDLTVARYGLYGVASLLLMLHPRFRPKRMSRRHLVTGFLLGVLAAPGYFVCAAFAVQNAGAAVPPLIIGLAPALLAIVANRQDAALPWRVLVCPLGLILAGLFTVNLDALRNPGAIGGAHPWYGLALSVVALAAWIGFGFVNATVMHGRSAPDGLHWTGLQGLGAGFGALLLLPMTAPATVAVAPAATQAVFWTWVVVMGIVGSWVATWCWVVASRRLPLGLLSQLIVAETVFGLLYGFLYERRLPTTPEWIGGGLQLVGVALAITLFSRPARASAMAKTAVLNEVALP